MDIKCSKCGDIWDYKGKSAFYATCPNCHRKNSVTIIENLKYATYIKCIYCGRKFPKKRNRSRYCSSICLNRANAHKGGRACHSKHDYNGKNNPHWKGGISKNNYHYKKIQTERYPERVEARHKLNKVVQSGKTRPPPKCEKCGKDRKLHGHHKDYSKPLDVKWYCRLCHRKIHEGKH